jgi:hypothetical protein
VASVQAAQRGRRQTTKLEESDVRPAGIGSLMLAIYMGDNNRPRKDG